MKPRITLITVAVALYLVSGLYVVKGNEQAVVRRFGKARAGLVAGGLHYDLPWPFANIDRINVHEVRTVAIGLSLELPQGANSFLREVNADRQAEFLTADKNILNLQVQVQYQIADPRVWLFHSEAPEIGLKILAESLVTDIVARSGVDFVHPLGLHDLRRILSEQTRTAVAAQPWGIEVEDVTISGVFPPVEVKAAFLDVSNARAEMERMIQEEQTRSEQLVAAARATSRQQLDQAESARIARVEAARGAADRFNKLIAQFQRESPNGGDAYAHARRMTLQRMYTATIEEILPRFAGKVFLDSDKPIDLTIFPRPEPPTPIIEPRTK